MEIILLYNLFQNITADVTYGSSEVDEKTGFGIQQHLESNNNNRVPLKFSVFFQLTSAADLVNIQETVANQPIFSHIINKQNQISQYLDQKTLDVPFNTIVYLGTESDLDIGIGENSSVTFNSSNISPSLSVSGLNAEEKIDMFSDFSSVIDSSANLDDFLISLFLNGPDFLVANISIDRLDIGYRLPFSRSHSYPYNINLLNNDLQISRRKKVHNETVESSRTYEITLEYLNSTDFEHVLFMIEMFGNSGDFYVKLENGDSMVAKLTNFNFSKFRNPGNYFNIDLVFKEI